MIESRRQPEDERGDHLQRGLHAPEPSVFPAWISCTSATAGAADIISLQILDNASSRTGHERTHVTLMNPAPLGPKAEPGTTATCSILRSASVKWTSLHPEPEISAHA